MGDLHDWQKQFKLKENLVEIDVEKLEYALAEMPRIVAGNAYRGTMLKSAIASGWIEQPATEVGEFEEEKRYFYDGRNVDEMHPGAVRWLGDQIDKAYSTATEVPKNL